MSDLGKLSRTENQESMNLAELAAWLHDIGKLSSEFINKQSAPNNKKVNWDHELVLKRSIQRIESQLGKRISEASKDDFRHLVENNLNTTIKPKTKQKSFPNPDNIGFLGELSTYLQHLNKRNEISITNSDIEQVKAFFGKYLAEQQISEGFLSEDFCNFTELNRFTILDQEATIADIIEQHGSPVDPRTDLVKIFKPPGCDAIDSAMDKGSLDKCATEFKQGTDAFIANAFGFEFKKIKDIDLARWALTNSEALLNGEREQRKNAIKNIFISALGETRRPANDVTLWDHSYSVGALYRTLLAKIILTETDFPALSSFLRDDCSEWNSESWRLLNIRTDGLKYLLSISSISDLLARKILLKDAMDRTQTLLEMKYPLGLEVYRDENGSIFVVPNVPDLLDSTTTDKSLSRKICENFQQGTTKNDISLCISGEIIPAVGPLSEAWNGTTKIPPIGKLLSEELLFSSDSESIQEAWMPTRVDIKKDECKLTEQICTVCGLRPQGYSAPDLRDHDHFKALKDKCPSSCQTCKAISRGICSICERRRSDRSKDWTTKKLDTTIWTDEVADINGRLALVVGFFDLAHWLNGDLIRTMTICDPIDAINKTTDVILKNPSFARLRRIWETTRNFWNDVCPANKTEGLEKSLVGQEIGLDGPRLEIMGRTKQNGRDEEPGPYHAYDLVLSKGIKLSISWDPQERSGSGCNGRLISIDNLVYFVSLSNEKAPFKEENECENDYRRRLHKWAAEVTRELILQEMIRGPLLIEEPTGYGGKAKKWGEIYVEDVEIIQDSQYTPAIPILAEPRTFMALVPADKALNVVNEIKAKYEREMGKVRNRLPMHLGIVYAHRRTPLRAILDAGRRMLNQSAMPGGWKVVCAARKLKDRFDLLPERLSTDGNGQFKEWLEILLEKDDRRINWFVPVMMGDGETLDMWYPYVFLDSSAEPADRDRRFKAPNPWTGSDGWLVYAADLKTDDVVFFTPATFDFQWLDSAGRRFEIAYDDKGQRLSMPRRPYLLDELESLIAIWQTLKTHLKKSQIYILRDLVEAKRVDWQEKTLSFSKDNVFWRFCRDAIANAEWRKGKEGNQKDKLPWEMDGQGFDAWLDRWTDYAVSGWITDAVELNLQIMKVEGGDQE